MKIKLLTVLGMVMGLSACSSTYLTVTDVSYVSLKNKHSTKNEAKTISIKHSINERGTLEVEVFNRSNEIMTVDRTKSFVVIGGVSTSFYDPTIKTTTHQTSSSNTRGATVNAGSVANALGAPSAVTQILRGVNVGGSSTSGSSTTKTEYNIDQPMVSIAPNGGIDMGRTFGVGVNGSFLSELSVSNTAHKDIIMPAISYDDSPIKFSVVITYSLDDGKSWNKIVSEYYVNALIQTYVRKKGEVNDALRRVLSSSDKLFTDSWSLLYFNVYSLGYMQSPEKKKYTNSIDAYLINNLWHNK